MRGGHGDGIGDDRLANTQFLDEIDDATSEALPAQCRLRSGEEQEAFPVLVGELTESQTRTLISLEVIGVEDDRST